MDPRSSFFVTIATDILGRGVSISRMDTGALWEMWPSEDLLGNLMSVDPL